MEYRGYLIEREPQFLLYVVNAIGRGSVHMSLRGYYQSLTDAKREVDLYENRKEVENGEKLQRSRGKQIQRRIKYRFEPSNNS